MPWEGLHTAGVTGSSPVPPTNSPLGNTATRRLREPVCALLRHSHVTVLALLIGLVGCAAPAEPMPQQQPQVSTVKRSLAVRRAFQREHPCPVNGKPRGACPGWVVDHIVPLACGGPDAPVNMQWQTREAAKAKDRWERDGC